MQQAQASQAISAGAPASAPALAPCRRPGEEPIPGYRLLEPLGKGGFGEVWRCEAPGGLFKAIKFVPGAGLLDSDSPASQEFAALQRVKTLRHPFLLSLERVEVVGGMLVVVMELADHSLHALHESCRSQGQPGIPRDDLLGYLLEAAEALDWMNFEHGLQHLDVKPHNLFLVSGHVKVADFGLVGKLSPAEANRSAGEDPESQGIRPCGGVTPLYSPPELLRGTLSRNSDQYSLAVVYQELLTGTLPFWHENVYELMMRHLSEAPNLEPLAEGDRAVVGRALAKIPSNRYPSCLEFMQALLGEKRPALRRSGQWRRVLVGDRPAAPSGVSTRGGDVTQRTPSPGGGAAPPIAPSKPNAGTPAKPIPRDFERTIFHPSADASQGLPTAASLPGYRFVTCLHQSPLGDLWRAEDAAGKPRRALCLLSFVRYDDRLIGHLRALRDPALPAAEVHWSPAERLVVLTDWHEGTLRDRFDEARARGLGGIPREELHFLLRSAAEALDALRQSHDLQHLGLNPRTLLVEGGRLRIADFGLIPLVWLPTGQSPALLNPRYSAAELFDGPPSEHADQSSLALIYAEMLTGVHPGPRRPDAGHPRAAKNGMARPAGKSGGRAATGRAGRLDLDLLPAPDRDPVTRALAINPEERFPSCTAFIEALEQAGLDAPVARDRYDELPPVIPFASLMGEEAGPNTILPPVAGIVAALTAKLSRPGGPSEGKVSGLHGKVCEGNNLRYVVQPDGSRVFRCPLQDTFAGSRPLKLEGLRAHWNGRLVEQAGDRFLLLIDVSGPRSFWERAAKQPRRLEVEIQFSSAGAKAGLSEAFVRVSCAGAEKEPPERILATMAPEVFQTVRVYFQATAEQRSRERVPLDHKLHVYPVLPDLDVAPTLEGRCKDLSAGGVRFQTAEEPITDIFYLHFYEAAGALGYAVLARKVRARPVEGGWDVGAEFPRAAPGA